MSLRPFPSCLLLCATLAPLSALAQQDEPISTDRPDFVNSADVVGKGTVQVETGFALERNRDAGEKERTTSTPVLLRVGVSDTLELRAETDGRVRHRVDGATRARERGWADDVIGIKWHARDADEGGPSVGFTLEADLDTGSPAFRGNGVQPALGMSAEWDLPQDMSLGVMPGLTRVKNDDGSHGVNGFFGIVLDKAWNDHFKTFAEFAAPQIAHAKNGGTQAQADVGVAWLLTRDCQLDAMYSRGLNSHTADHAVTVGLSFRL
ncbi:outer membrane putative beta-barrel porin/alpha-amylase [Pseudoduganella lurida]|uniref:Outer membrane putative beta-barrel porin/alpha-amylase n=1 Tax=Pseudoduganella lurida TaxID=1036180 RepID=A0A562RBB7_9BURK|nr:transporter [Pseudoduganella lurida]TWI66361.1 outer membrane putative beta-barrel porin/alpha-amylase [Pseudoduganella lurida]